MMPEATPYIFLPLMILMACSGAVAALAICWWLERNQPWDIRPLELTESYLSNAKRFEEIIRQIDIGLAEFFGIPAGEIERNHSSWAEAYAHKSTKVLDQFGDPPVTRIDERLN